MASKLMASKQLDPLIMEVFESEYYPLVDLVYRFGVTLSQSREGGERVCEEVYRRLFDELGRAHGGLAPTEHLIRLTWQAWGHLRGHMYHPWNQSLISSLAALDVEAKAALFVVDVVGISPIQAAKLLDIPESEVRLGLVEARKRLCSKEIVV
jgi:hypothetical protein